jgi:hypothetical protein
MLAIQGFKTNQGQWLFEGNKNPKHSFLQKESKSGVPCHTFTTCKRTFHSDKRQEKAKLGAILVTHRAYYPASRCCCGRITADKNGNTLKSPSPEQQSKLLKWCPNRKRVINMPAT